MAKIVWTAEAELWLQDIHEYVARDNPDAANQTIENIYSKVQVLIEYPVIGYRYEQLTDHNIRILLYGHFKIAYLIKSNNDIHILGVFHGALNIDQYLV